MKYFLNNMLAEPWLFGIFTDTVICATLFPKHAVVWNTLLGIEIHTLYLPSTSICLQALRNNLHFLLLSTQQDSCASHPGVRARCELLEGVYSHRR